MKNIKHKVLIIEDNGDLLEQYKLKLEHEGFLVITATDGEDGLLVAADERPDVILLDILMPNMNGFDVLRGIKNNTTLKTIIIIISNLSDEDQIKKAKELGALDYFVKSDVTPDIVVKKVKSLFSVLQVKL